MFRGFLRKILKLFLSLKMEMWGKYLTCFSIFAYFLMKAPEGGGDEYRASHPAPKSWYCFGNLDWLLFCKKETLRILSQFWGTQLLNRVRKRSQVWKNTIPTFSFFHKTHDKARSDFLIIYSRKQTKNISKLIGLFS